MYIEDLKGLTKSTLKDSDALVIHFKKGKDEYLHSKYVEEIIVNF